MRGLEIRISYAMAKVMRVIDEEKAKLEVIEALNEAKEYGFFDYSAGFKEAPIMFLDEPKLLEAWQKGWYFHSEADEMENCPGCNNQDGTPCPFHD
ncbi:hypothetical protein IU285_004545 [Salmonella enterica]|nr:hypothetical protein [Salmonella enterica]EGO6494890.1 hypothetical protein [Salmonella enterica]